MANWLVRPFTETAKQEALTLFANSAIKAECQHQLRLLATEIDPGKPENPILDVKHLEHDAPNWYRLKIASLKIRLIYSLAYTDGEKLVDYQYGERPFDSVENFILLHYLTMRTDTTYREARRRWRAARRS